MLKGILALQERCEKYQVIRKHGAGEDIEYTYRKSNTINNTRAFVNYGQNEDEKVLDREDTKIFYMVELPHPPNRRDSVKYNNDTYLVDSYKKINAYSDLYDIVCLSHVASKHHRPTR